MMARGRTVQERPEELLLNTLELGAFYPERRRQPGNLVPELRVIRGVNLDVDIAPLHRLADALGRRNYGKGTAAAVGSWAVTMVSATEMGRMLEAKYPKVYESRRKTLELHRRFAKHYQQFVQSAAKGIDDQIFCGVQVRHEIDRLVGDNFDEADELIEAVAPDVDDTLWVPASFGISGYGKFASDCLGLNLANNEAFAIEMEGTLDFLKWEGLNTNIVDRDRAAHITVFRTFGNLGGTALTALQPPTMIALEAPRMWVNSNEPSQQY